MGQERDAPLELAELLVTDDAPLDELERASAIPRSWISRARLYTCSDAGEIAKLTGFPKKAFGATDMPALVIPYFFPGDPDPGLFSVKPAKPKEWTDASGRAHLAKYVRTKGVSPVPPYLPPDLVDNPHRLFDPAVPKIITEGEKKALSAAALGFATLSLSGVDNWRGKKQTKRLHPLLAQLAATGADVYLAYDSDRVTNIRGVRRAESELAQALTNAGAKCFNLRVPPTADGSKQGLDDFIAAFGADAARRVRTLVELARRAGPMCEPTPAAAPPFAAALSDLGNAERLAKYHGQDLRYCDGLGGWYVWDGRRWAKDDLGEVQRRANDTVRRVFVEAAEATDIEARASLVEHAQKSQSRRALEASISLARSLKGIPVRASDFDSARYRISVLNGILDLETGELHAHDRAALHTKIAPVHFDPDARSEVWEKFLDTATGGDEELQAFLQRAVGYSLTGDTREDRLFFVHGPAAAGKSTFFDAIKGALGDYSRTADFTTFLSDGKTAIDRPRPDLVRLVGARMVVSIEVDDGKRLAEGLVKGLTGGDKMTLRDLYGSAFEFRPTFKLWLCANHTPRVRADDEAMWRRILRIPFDKEIPEAKRDPRIKNALRDVDRSGAAILAWAVRGCLQWQKEGLCVPTAIRSATNDYRVSMDPFAEFFETRCAFETYASETRKALREAYEEWARDAGMKPACARRFGDAVRARLRAAGVERAETTKREEGRVRDAWRGVRLRTPMERERINDSERRDHGDRSGSEDQPPYTLSARNDGGFSDRRDLRGGEIETFLTRARKENFINQGPEGPYTPTGRGKAEEFQENDVGGFGDDLERGEL